MIRYVLGTLSVFILLVVVFILGHQNGYDKRDALANMELITQLAEKDLETARIARYYEEKFNEAEKEKAISIAAADAANTERLQLNKTLNKLRAQLSANPSSNDDALTSCWDVFEESAGRYTEVARDADRLVDTVREGQVWFGAYDLKNK